MERYIIKYPNGKIRQQRGINMTYHNLLGIGAISYIIDIKKGNIMYGDKDETVHTEKISTYVDSDLIISED